jgi:hypothetical protein
MRIVVLVMGLWPNKAEDDRRDSCGLEFRWSRDETNFNALFERGGDAPEHCEGVSLVIGILKSANHGGGGANQPGEFALRQAGGKAQFGDLPGDVICGAHCFQPGNASGFSFVITAVENRYSIASLRSEFVHVIRRRKCVFPDPI